MDSVKLSRNSIISGPLSSGTPTLVSAKTRERMPDFLAGYDTIAGSRGSYTVHKQIGIGGMATIFLGQHHTLHPVVLKFSTLAEHDLYLSREASALAYIRHDNVVQAYDSGSVEGRLFLVLERLVGSTLYTTIQERGCLDPDVAAFIAIEVLKGIGAAHAISVSHTDLKPENVFLHETVNDMRVKVIDFGLCRGMDEALANCRAVGTPGYMSPEQALAGSFDHRADLYSIGMLLYEMMTGMLPFSGTKGELLMKTITEVPAKPSTIVPSIPKSLESITMKALEKDPERRFQSAGEFRQALETALEAMGSVS